MRVAGIADREIVLEMAEAFHQEDGHPLTSFAGIEALLAGSPLGRIYLIENGGAVVGYCALCFTMSLEFGGVVVILDDLYVKPRARGGGIGSRVIAEVQSLAQEMGAVQVFLEVENANERAFRLYERLGFAQRDRRMMDRRFSATENR